MSQEGPAHSNNKGTSHCGYEWSTDIDTEKKDAAATGSCSVLWENRFQQTIRIGIDDDNNLEVSHLQSSFTVHVSQASAASSDKTYSSSLYNDEEESPKSLSSISSEEKHHSNTRNSTESEIKALFPQPSKSSKQMQLPNKDDDTSDEDQEELPFDDELHHSKQDLKTPTMNTECGQGSDGLNSPRQDAIKINEGFWKPDKVLASLPDFLLRHFSQDELLNYNKLIEAETMPEVSLLESIDETIKSNAVPNPHTIPASHRTEVKPSLSILISKCGESQTASQVTDLKTAPAESQKLKNNNNDKVFNQSDVHNLLGSSEESRLECINYGSFSTGARQDKMEENVKTSCSSSTPNLYKANAQNFKCPLARTRSCSELKYGQGQVHYPLPDFSKVAPKVKIPKSNGVTTSGCNSVVDRSQKQPGMLGKSLSPCKVDVISRVLEDSVWLNERPNMLRDEAQSRLNQELKAEYDRILAKCAEMGPVDKIQASNEPSLIINWEETADVIDMQHRKKQIRAVPETFQSPKEGRNEEKIDVEQQILTEGQRLSIELKEIITQYNIKVEEFKTCVNSLSVPVEEQQMLFKCMLEAQDQLERNYMIKKEEHRALEMQSYIGLNKNIGEFDPDRQVEGEIFRLGMHLEDIKELIDKNVCRGLSPIPSSNTPTVLLHAKIVSPLKATQQKETSFSSSTSNHGLEGKDDYFKASNEVSSPAQSSLSCPKDSSFKTCQMSWISRQDDDGKVSMTGSERDSMDVLAQLTNSVSQKSQRTTIRPRDVEYLIPEPLQHYTNKTQAFVRPEADSSFGTSDLNLPPAGQTDTESPSPSNVSSLPRTSMTESHPHGALDVTCAEPNKPLHNVQNMQWTYTTENTPISLQSEGQVSLDGATLPIEKLQEAGQRLPSPLIQTTPLLKMPTTDTYSHCTCPNSEAIRALQNEVSQLKKVLEKTLGPLAYLSGVKTQEMSLRAQRRPASTRCRNTLLQTTEDWISSDTESCKDKGMDSGDSDYTEISLRPTHKHTHFKYCSSRRFHDLDYSSTASSENLFLDASQCRHSNYQRASNESVIPSIRNSARPISYGNTSNTNFGLSYHRNASIRNTRSSRSCCSLPSGFKVQVEQPDPEVINRRRSTQSDTALLQSNAFFQWASFLPTSAHRIGTRARRHKVSKEGAINQTLNKALDAVLLMKQSTDRMAKTLSADLAKAQVYRKLHGLHSLCNKEKP